MGSLATVEAVEDEGLLLGRDADACVLDGEEGVFFFVWRG